MTTTAMFPPMTSTIHWKTEDDRYLCNQACSTTDCKKTNDELKVTCLNCQRRISKKFPKDKLPNHYGHEKFRQSIKPKLDAVRHLLDTDGE